jgi:hypothetical protein
MADDTPHALSRRAMLAMPALVYGTAALGQIPAGEPQRGGGLAAAVDVEARGCVQTMDQTRNSPCQQPMSLHFLFCLLWLLNLKC